MQIMDSLAEGMLKMPPEQCKRALAALYEFQQTGEAPDLSDDWALDAWWASVAPVVQNSRDISERRAAAGARGGRPRKQDGAGEKQTQADGEQAPMGEKQAGSNGKQTESKRKQAESNEKQTKAEEEEEEEEEKEHKGRACAGAPDLDPLGEPGPSRGYRHPTPAEVEAFVAAGGGHPVSGEDFCAWYDDHGWPPRGWQGTAMSWSRRERDRAARGHAAGALSRGRATPDASQFAAYGGHAVSAAEIFGEEAADAAGM